mmetsp:Transcript_79116/g.228810  ORF Transcript_79116/g.228810 Transcript_79116/m.228810 type:complete len:253 (-) Transcript_79116:813-1571(-)
MPFGPRSRDHATCRRAFAHTLEASQRRRSHRASALGGGEDDGDVVTIFALVLLPCCARSLDNVGQSLVVGATLLQAIEHHFDDGLCGEELPHAIGCCDHHRPRRALPLHDLRFCDDPSVLDDEIAQGPGHADARIILPDQVDPPLDISIVEASADDFATATINPVVLSGHAGLVILGLRQNAAAGREKHGSGVSASCDPNVPRRLPPEDANGCATRGLQIDALAQRTELQVGLRLVERVGQRSLHFAMPQHR